MALKHFPLHNSPTLIMLFPLLLILSAGPVVAQTPTPTPRSEEVIRLEEEKAQAQLRQAIAEANKAELEARFPRPTSSPLSGTTTINDTAIIEGQIIAYVALARAANKVVSGIRLNNINVSRLAIFNEDDIRLLLSYKTSKSQLEVLRQSYCQLLSTRQTRATDCPNEHAAAGADLAPESFVPPLTIARSLLGSFVDLTSFLRTNVEIKGQTFDIDEAPLVAEVLRASRRPGADGLNNAEIYYPRMYPPDFEPNKQYFILGALEVVLRLRTTAGRLIAELEKNGEDLGRAETKVETLRTAVNNLNLSRARAQERLKNILIPAHCTEVPECDGDDPTAVEALLRRHCPRLSGEQRERVLELANQIRQLDSELASARSNLANAQNALERLEAERARLWEAFNTESNANRSEAQRTTNALVIADIAGQLKARNEQFDKFVAALVQAGTGGGANALTSLLKAENIQAALAPTAAPTPPQSGKNPEQPGKSYWLQLKVVKAGGNNRIKTNLLWDIFTGGNRVSHSGGVIVEYILYETTGRAVASDTITEYTDYIKAGKVRQLPTREIDDIQPNE